MLGGNNGDTLFQLSINAQWKQALNLTFKQDVDILNIFRIRAKLDLNEWQIKLQSLGRCSIK